MFTSDPELKSLVQAAVTSSGLPPAVIDAVISRYQEPAGVRAEELAELIGEWLHTSSRPSSLPLRDGLSERTADAPPAL